LFGIGFGLVYGFKSAVKDGNRKGNLLICFSSGSKNHLGKVALVDNNYNYAFGGFIGQINPKREVDSKYLFYSLISEQYKQYISELTDGVNINNLKIKDLQNFQILLLRFSPPNHRLFLQKYD
jgi:restriction endonuclease S subunit